MNKNTINIITAVSLASIISMSFVGSAFAQGSMMSGSSTGTTTRFRGMNQQQRIENMHTKGDKEVQNRIDALNKLSARIQAMKNLSDTQKSSFALNIQNVISNMNNLQAKINSDTSTTTLSADLKTIAPDYRIYMLVMPQISILSAVDRVNTLVTSLGIIQNKIQTRISADSSLSSNTSISSSLADITSKLSDASAQASAAQAKIISLMPDRGDKTVMQSNTTALKDARAKIQAATKDLEAVRKDVKNIISIIIKSEVNSL